MAQNYYLIDSKNYVVGKLVIEKAESNYVMGVCYECISWTTDNEPYEWHFSSDVYCKWDACTHWNFYGEDYDGTVGGKEDADSYYHLCTAGGFNNHIRLMCFVWKVVCDIMTELSEKEDEEYIRNNIHKNYFESETTKKLVELMLDGYIITTDSVDISKVGKLSELKIGK